MKTTEIVGLRRSDMGTKYSRALRADGNVPSVLYGGDEVIHFHTPAYLYRELLYTPDAYIVELNVEGVEKKCILKEAQFHPVSEALLHVDLLEIFDDKEVIMNIPIKLIGDSVGVAKGGQVYTKSKTLKVKALPGKLPQEVEVDVTELDLGNSLTVRELGVSKDFEIITKQSVSVAQIIVPRALKSIGVDEEGEGTEEGETPAEGEAPAAG